MKSRNVPFGSPKRNDYPTSNSSIFSPIKMPVCSKFSHSFPSVPNIFPWSFHQKLHVLKKFPAVKEGHVYENPLGLPCDRMNRLGHNHGLCRRLAADLPNLVDFTRWNPLKYRDFTGMDGVDWDIIGNDELMVMEKKCGWKRNNGSSSQGDP